MKLHDLRPAEGSKHRRRRVGRGISAGQGKTAGRGTKGQGARTGAGIKPYFEGGQLPLVRRLPHTRGFTNIHRVEYAPINLDTLNAKFDAGSQVTPDELAARGLVSETARIKVLGRGELTKSLTVKAHAFSDSAKEKIAAAGGTAEQICQFALRRR
ncbi:MAG: 50S ribosomal protein L15 [Chloroflexi bacterium]|nr:50S ribosomal protein L15 [Chloroflexota bacterium]